MSADTIESLRAERDEARGHLERIRDLVMPGIDDGMIPMAVELTMKDRSKLIDRIDMMRDEFQRISAAVQSGPETFTKARDIIDFCERAQREIAQRVPVIQQRDQLQQELRMALSEQDHFVRQLADAGRRTGAMRRLLEEIQKAKPASGLQPGSSAHTKHIILGEMLDRIDRVLADVPEEPLQSGFYGNQCNRAEILRESLSEAIAKAYPTDQGTDEFWEKMNDLNAMAALAGAASMLDGKMTPTCKPRPE